MTGVASLLEVIEGPAALDPDRCALIIGAEATSFGELNAMATRCAAHLRARGASPGERLPLVDDASLLSVSALLGAPRIGAAAALMNPRLTSGELQDLVRAARASHIGVAGAPYLKALRHVLDGVVGEEALSASNGPAELSDASEQGTRPNDEAVVLFTSGTTGLPKAVPLTHGLLGPRISAFAPSFDPSQPAAVSLMCVPLVHIGGMLGLMVSLARGATTVVQTRFDPGEWLSLAERYRVNTAFVVPTMLHRILEHPDFSRTDLSALHFLSYGAAPASPRLIARAVSSLPGVAFSNVFGQTETLGSITALGPEDHARGGSSEKLASVGRPLPGVEVRVVDPSTGEPVPVGTVGELWVRTAASVLPSGPSGRGPKAPEGWLKTGDMVSADTEGYLYPAGRLTDTINRAGEKFSPSEVEEVLRAHPAVADVAVAGIPDPEMGNRVGAAVVCHEPVTPRDLREFCRERLASFKLPERVAFVDEIPYNDFGKVPRRELSALIAKMTT